MTLTKYIQYGFVVLVLFASAYFAGVHTLLAKAAGLVFAPANCYTAAATSTLAYMTWGAATTTVSCGMGNDGADTAVLAIIVNATSTNTIYNFNVEESMDGHDWYPIAINQTASTSPVLTLTDRRTASLRFASSTIGGGGSPVVSGVGVNGTNNRNHYTMDVPVRMKRVRAYASISSAATTTVNGNGAIWMQIIPKVGI